MLAAFALSLTGAAKEIINTARVDFQLASAGPVGLLTNETQLTINHQIAFSLLDENHVLSPAGATSVLPHRAGNHGADQIDLVFDFWNQTGNPFDLENICLFFDTNGNGRIDAGEPEIRPGTARAFASGEQISILACAAVPADAPHHASALLVIRATEASTGTVIHRVNTVKVRPDGLGLMVQKSASRPEAEVGETVAYTVRVRNVTEALVADAQLFFELPVGFAFEPGSLRLGGSRIPDPVRQNGRLVVDLPDLAADETVSLSYRARIGAVALRGDGINRAYASSASLVSNVAMVRVRVREGIFTSNGVILGRVFADTNGNGRPDSGEEGLPGVRLYLEDGTYVITDAHGKYSFYGVSPRVHVLKLDRTSVPPGTRFAGGAFRQAGDAGSRFVDLKRSELHRADFGVVLTPDGDAEIEARRTATPAPTEIEHGLSGRLTTDGQTPLVSDPKAQAASGVITAPAELALEGSAALVRPVAPARNAATSPAPADAPRSDDNAWLSAITDNTLGFVALQDGMVLPTAQTDVLVKGPAGAQFTLAVNGALFGAERVGFRATLPACEAEAWKFIGLDLMPGENRLRATMLDPFGNPRGETILTVFAPGSLAQMRFAVEDVIADGTTPARVLLELADARGTPVTARTAVTLQASRGEWQVDDLDPMSPGVQIFVEGGRRVLLLTSPLEPGECEILADSGAIHTRTGFAFRPDLRPLIATGVIEGTLNFGDRGRGALLPTGSRDAFEQELRSLSASSGEGRLAGGGRAAFFLKGKVRGDFLLTAAYDSDKASGTRLFRDIQPGEYYPVYGDASIRGYDAQSTGRLYVRIDRNRSYALIGDFTTTSALGPQAGDIRTLGSYQRSFSGVKEHFENDRIRANVWASQDSTRQIVAEVPANGTSGPYAFSFHDVIVNSERIELVTRDRNQPSRVIAVRELARFSDYEFEPFTGRLLFAAPVASLDPDLNPVSIRITAEVEQGGGKFWTYGADAQGKLGQRVEVAAGYARDENPADLYELASVGASVRLAAPTILTAELAASRSETGGEGLAGRVELQHRTEATDVRLHVARTDPEFSNPGALLLPGRLEGGYKLTHKLAPSLSLLSEGLVSENIETGGRLTGARVDLERAFGGYRILIGGRHSEETAVPANPASGGATPNTVDSLRAKLTGPLPRLARGTGYLEYEQDIRSSGRQMAALGLDYNFATGGRAYGRHEFIASLGGPFNLNDRQSNHTTLVGLEKGYMKDGQLFNEYRASNEITGREAEAALGLRNLWRLTDGVNASTTFERVTPVSGERRDESTALTGQLVYARDPRWRATARLELRWSPASDSVLNSLGYARQLDADWTLLGKTILLLTESPGPSGGRTLQGRAQGGFAWRPASHLAWNALGKYELKYESDTRRTAAFSSRLAHLVALDCNYQPGARWSASAHYAGKWVAENTADGDRDLLAHLVATRFSHQFAKRWEAGLNLSALLDGDFRQARFAAGPELNYIAMKNLLLGAGFNFVGFHDRDLASDGTSARGFYVRLRLKFDESLLQDLGRRARS